MSKDLEAKWINAHLSTPADPRQRRVGRFLSAALDNVLHGGDERCHDQPARQQVDGKEEVLVAQRDRLGHAVVHVAAVAPLAHDPRDHPALLQHHSIGRSAIFDLSFIF